MIKLRAIGRCLFFLQSCRTSNYVRSVAMSWFQSDVCVMERLLKKFYSNYLYELRWIKWNDGGDCELWLSPASTTSATPSPAASPTTWPSFRYITLPSLVAPVAQPTSLRTLCTSTNSCLFSSVHHTEHAQLAVKTWKTDNDDKSTM